MPYPPTILKKPVRRLIMLFLIVIFFVAAPALILYTAGFSYNWRTRKIEQTGVISISFEPKDARIVLNGIDIKQTSPIRLPNRRPGTYKLRLEKSGFYPWEKEITVNSQKTTFIRDISLLAISVPEQMDAHPSPIALSGSNDGLFLAVLEKNTTTTYSYSIWSTKDETEAFRLSVNSETEPLASWSKSGRFVAISSKTSDGCRLDVLSADFPKLFYNQYFLSMSSCEGFQWKETSVEPELFIMEDDSIFLLSNGGKKLTAKLNNTTAWYIDTEQNVWQFDKAHKQITANKKNFAFPLGDYQDPTKIIHVNKNRAIIGSPNSTIIISLRADGKNFEFSEIETTKIYENSATKEWLAWSPWEIWSIYPDGKTTLLNRTSERMEEILPLDKFGVVLISSPTTLASFNPGYYTSQEIYHGNHVSSIVVNQKEREIYFLAPLNSAQRIFKLKY